MAKKNKSIAKVDSLQAILNSGSVDKCLSFFRDMPESNRRDYFPTVKTFWNQVRKRQFIEDPPGTFSWNPLTQIASAAYFATATGAEIIKAKRSGYPDDDAAFEIIKDRRPTWTNQWIESLLGETYYWMHWRLIRRLIEAGLANKPDTPRYYLGMISAINFRGSKISIEKQLEPSDLLEHDLWKLFEYDGDGENSLANTERFASSWIDAFLSLSRKGKLSREKLLTCSIEALERDFNHYRAKWYYQFFDRLDPTEEELARYAPRILGLLSASAPNVVSWALSRVESLASEGKFDTNHLCHSLSPSIRSRAKSVVITSLKLLERQAALFPNDHPDIAKVVAEALFHESSDVQKTALKMLQKIASPPSEEVCCIAEKALPSIAASVKQTVNKWLTTSLHTTPKKDKLNTNAIDQPEKTPAVVLAKRLKLPKQIESVFAIDQLQQNLQSDHLSIPAATFDGTELPRLAVAQKLVPIESVEELIDVCARVVEDGSLVDDAERCIDGMTRLCGSKPNDLQRLAAPLLKRISKLIQKGASPFCGVDPANDVMGMFYVFCTDQEFTFSRNGRKVDYEFEGVTHSDFAINLFKPIGFLSDRCFMAAKKMISGQGFQLLSSPTHAGGWIDPIVLAKRVNVWSNQQQSEIPDAHDVILAMLRLAPDSRAAALKQLKAKEAEWVQCIAYALGSNEVSIGKNAALWAMAARSRSPWQDDPKVMKRHPRLGPDAGQAAQLHFVSKTRKSGQYTFRDASFEVSPAVSKTFDPLLITVRLFSATEIGRELSFEMGGFGGRTVGAVRWTTTIWPLARESFFASSVAVCFDNLDWWEAQWQNRTMLEPLIDSGTPLRQAGLYFLVGMLAAKEPGESGLATDIAIRAIEDGRLGSNNLGKALKTLLQSEMIKPGRWHKTLREISRASTVHAAVVQISLQECFDKPAKELPKDSSKLLELLHELTIELGTSITNETCRDWLNSGTATGKAAKIAKSLLSLDSEPKSKSVTRSILIHAINMRSQAASRFGE